MDDELNKHIVDMQNSRLPGADPPLPIKPLKIPPKYGVYRWWPVDENWVHPDDLETANALIPSDRVFRREGYDQEYSLLLYGKQFIRVRPVIWLEIQSEGYELGDQIEGHEEDDHQVDEHDGHNHRRQLDGHQAHVDARVDSHEEGHEEDHDRPNL